MSKIGLIVVTVIALELFGCASTGKIISQTSVTRLNGEQAKAYISGKTISWVGGGAHYNPDGNMDVEITMRVKSSGNWKVFDDGRVCYQIPDWEQYCHIYLIDNGSITRQYIENAR